MKELRFWTAGSLVLPEEVGEKPNLKDTGRVIWGLHSLALSLPQLHRDLLEALMKVPLDTYIHWKVALLAVAVGHVQHLRAGVLHHCAVPGTSSS
jgi:hypothetical protein